jgi:hypothetical protein
MVLKYTDFCETSDLGSPCFLFELIDRKGKSAVRNARTYDDHRIMKNSHPSITMLTSLSWRGTSMGANCMLELLRFDIWLSWHRRSASRESNSRSTTSPRLRWTMQIHMRTVSSGTGTAIALALLPTSEFMWASSQREITYPKFWNSPALSTNYGMACRDSNLSAKLLQLLSLHQIPSLTRENGRLDFG